MVENQNIKEDLINKIIEQYNQLEESKKLRVDYFITFQKNKENFKNKIKNIKLEW